MKKIKEYFILLIIMLAKLRVVLITLVLLFSIVKVYFLTSKTLLKYQKKQNRQGEKKTSLSSTTKYKSWLPFQGTIVGHSSAPRSNYRLRSMLC